MSGRIEVHNDWRRYPFRLVADDNRLEFPAAEGEHPDQESDTWFIAGELIGMTGRSFAFLSIFNKNRPGGVVVADFYTMSLFDCGTGAYGTYTDYDMPPASMRAGAQPKLSATAGHLDIRYDSSAGLVAWTTCRDERGGLQPYTYSIHLLGVDQADQSMELDLTVTPTRPPVPVGASTYNGKIICFGQHETYSYFQTGMTMTGTLRWGDLCEQVNGSAGHVDRQWFPTYAGGGGTGGDPRAWSHEWRTITLNNGVDLSIWRQFDRMEGNALQPFSGVTASYPDPEVAPECGEDVEVTVNSYVQWPHSIQPLLPPLSPLRFMPDRHWITCATLQLDLTGEPLVAAPAHSLPIEYMEGPYRYRGTLRGKAVRGFGFYERSLALYRDWELVEVLAAAVDHIHSAEPQLAGLADQVRPLVESGRRAEARELLQTGRAALHSDTTGCRDVVDALIEALSSAD
jgi:predicted secreted hydrolase